ncbi:methyl-accepting chemotaxis protein [Veronia pacifica]|uniref:Chemotaxis protein n=1 Tax=Veronia pacifica TaxID=1080227 RepID=A0A1C3E8H4_9GAMM|nr:methyl-accepting chemotaxis protein [Veronia pacifica]ODA29449.1 chemotaxis protein [Veronia pacifica]
MARFGLRSITIKQRLYLLTTVISLLLVLPFVLTLMDYKSDLLKAKQDKTRDLVDSAQTLLSYYHSKQLSGELSMTDAQQAAKKAISALRYEGTNYFWINNLEPRMVMHPIKPALNGKNIANKTDANGKALFLEMVDTARKHGQGFVYYMWPKPGSDVDVEKLSYVQLFKPWNWIIGTGVYIDDVDALVWQRLQSAITMLFISVIVMAIAASWISRSLTRPCRATQNAMEDIASGEGDLTKHLAVDGKDEISHIATAFNLFTDKLRHIVTDISPITRDVTSSAIELTEVARDASSRVVEQQNAVDAVSDAMEALQLQNQEVTEAARTAANAAQKASERSGSGSQIITEASGHMQQLSQTVESTQKNVRELAEETQKVSAVLDVIRGVAEQTNLLALNAAIEAARAGEQGRGFAVVADEVRTLATRTSSSTDEIEQIVTTLQARADDVCHSMSQTQTQSIATQEKASLAHQTLEEIDHQITSILAVNQHIAEAVSDQLNSANAINQNLSSLAENSNMTAAQANQVAAASEQLMQSGKQLERSFAVFKV